MDPQADDLRSTELESLEAIYPEIRRPLPQDPFTFEIDLPVAPADPITVTFPPPSGPVAGPGQGADVAGPEDDSLQVSHLPSLVLRISLPEGYPEDVPPKVDISTHPQWLPSKTLQMLQDEAPRLWEEVGRDMVAYSYIDHVHRAADDVFGATNPDGTLAMDSQHKLALLDYDIKAKKEAFDKETFDCGVCLDPKKGSKCHKMLDCGHIFCLQCLQDFYNDAIQEGSLQTVRCLTPNCAKDRTAAAAKPGVRLKKPKVYISPSELLQIGLTEDAVKRYVALKYKTELETDKNTIYCPRPTCNGAARSERHKKPEGFELNDVSDTESAHGDDDDGPSTDGSNGAAAPVRNRKPYDPSDLLAICEDCGFAFCRRCYQSWHGEFIYCVPKVENGEMSAEDKASLEYLHLHTSPCPTCSAPAQKTHGCNHMICSRCDTHFCYLCSAWLDPTNPYRHYNLQPDGKVTSCYMRLWELEGGDGDDVGLGFVGGIIERLDQAPPQDPQPVDIPAGVALEERAHPPNANNGPQAPAGEEGPPPPPPPAVAREAPLVLRIMDQRPRPANPPADHQVRHVGGRGRGQRGRGRGGRGQVAQRGARGQRGRGGVGRPAQAPPPALRHPGNRQMADINPGDMVGQMLANDAPLDEEQAAWVRRFVEMALLDAEDEIDGDSDDDINFLIR
ncbi:IBR domain, a half RING-finger domain-containing protein [Sarocladium implicatum]|nr:IBR domain, a half RING-finger domain-containing protein [Sarocladium implicatum]